MVRCSRRQLICGLAGMTAAPLVLAGTRTFAADKIRPDAASALIVVDVQNCFLPGGSLAVKDGDQVIPVINKIAGAFDNVILIQDWHTTGHISFASSHAGKKPFDVVRLPYGLGAVAGSLRARDGRRGALQGPLVAEGAARDPQGFPPGRRQLLSAA